jgi:hypothetical protein
LDCFAVLEPSQLLEFGLLEYQRPRNAALVLEYEHSAEVELSEVMMQQVLLGYLMLWNDPPLVAILEGERFALECEHSAWL